MPRGQSACLLSRLFLALLRAICGRGADGGPAPRVALDTPGAKVTGSACTLHPPCDPALFTYCCSINTPIVAKQSVVLAEDHSLPAARFFWGHFSNAFTWPEVLRRYVAAADAMSVGWHQDTLRRGEGRPDFGSFSTGNRTLLSGDAALCQAVRGQTLCLVRLYACAGLGIYNLGCDATRGVRRWPLTVTISIGACNWPHPLMVSVLCACTALEDEPSYLSLRATQTLALLRFLVNDALTLPVLEVKQQQKKSSILSG